ncbi:hypothetical protein L4G92_03950 [Neisseria sp. ZJ106]|uniref:Secreted protein n=1 Tax=Neisseria lisongii TaxID=2912188 RepID=A0ABY7RJ85_9NEIS|nr:hypothetical protein [Neisseria lisongii]MCF7521206.1 hypothetical protein [Neisseria lisongii]WCL71699.1 hypothetical protein PJU73_00790 [Neisseria lisongii]
MSTRKLFTIGIALLVFAAIKLILLDIFWQQSAAEQTACDVRQGCTLPNGAYVKFSGTVSAKTPFSVELRNVAAEVGEVSVSFAMKDMDMGFNRYPLQRSTDGAWQADHIRLPLCVAGRRDYLADINIGGQVFQTAFSAE